MFQGLNELIFIKFLLFGSTMHVLNRTSFAGGGLCRFSLSHLFTSVQFSGPLLGDALRFPKLNDSAEIFFSLFLSYFKFL